MKLAISILFCIVVFYNSINASELNLENNTEWNSYKTKFEKKYPNKKEEIKAFITFSKNLERIRKHNEEFEKGEKSFSLGINQFTDMTIEKFNSKLNKYQQPNEKENSNAQSFQSIVLADVPDSVDYRSQLTRIKNQGLCGSCWAFSTTSCLEYQIKKTTGQIHSLSEQNLVDCATNGVNNGCDGGNVPLAFEFIQQNGIDSRESYPYTSRNMKNGRGTCKYEEGTDTLKKLGLSIQGIGYVVPKTEDMLKQYIAQYGVMSVSIYAGLDSFKDYAGGIYYEPNCPTKSNHAVNLVGYGSENGQDFWILRNSWGTTWGENGYMKFARNKNNMCGVASYASYPYLNKNNAPAPLTPTQCYLGCANDNPELGDGYIDLFRASNLPRGQKTIESCIQVCAKKNRKYAALAFGQYCGCGGSYNKYGLAQESACSIECRDNQNQKCGGRSKWSVYDVSCATGSK